MSPDHQAYIDAAASRFRPALTTLHAQLRGLVPGAEEVISYAMPAFRLPNGKVAAGFAAFSRHCGLYPFSGGIIRQLDAAEIAGFSTSKSGILFTEAAPLPAALVARIVALRLAEIAGARGVRT